MFWFNKSLFLIFVLLGRATFLFSQIENSGRMMAMAGAGLASIDITHISTNPAGILQRRASDGDLPDFLVQMAYKPNLLHDDVHENAIWVARSLKDWIHVGASFKQLRFHRTYYENIWSLALTRSFGRDFGLGISIDRSIRKVSGFASQAGWDLNVGSRSDLSSNWKLGIAVQGLIGSVSGEYMDFSNRFSPTGTVGVQCQLFPALNWVFDCTWRSHALVPQKGSTRLALKTGFEYDILQDTLWLRAGWRSNPVGQFFGLGYRWNNFGIDLAFGNTGRTGMVPQIDLSYGK